MSHSYYNISLFVPLFDIAVTLGSLRHGKALVRSNLGQIIGGEEFIPLAMTMAERRTGKESVERRRVKDKGFDPLEKVFQEFEREH